MKTTILFLFAALACSAQPYPVTVATNGATVSLTISNIPAAQLASDMRVLYGTNSDFGTNISNVANNALGNVHNQAARKVGEAAAAGYLHPH